MSTLDQIIRPRGIVELGKIKIGRKEAKARQSKGGGEWRAPEKLDHFILTTLERDERGDFMPDEKLMASLVEDGWGGKDGKLRQIPILLLSDDIEDCMSSRLVWYSGKSLGASSDRKTVRWLVDPQTRKPLDSPRESPWKEEYIDQYGFKLHTIFSCVIKSKAGRFGGCYKLRTTSGISAEQLLVSLRTAKQITGGPLQGIPLVMVLRPIQVSPDGKPITVYVVHIEIRGSDLEDIRRQALAQMQYQTQYAREIQTAQIEYRRLLKAPDEFEDETEEADVAEEFHPPDDIQDAEFERKDLASELSQEAQGVSGLASFREQLALCRTSKETKAIFEHYLGAESPLTDAEQVAAGAEYQKKLDAQVQAEAAKAAEDAKKPKDEKLPTIPQILAKIMAAKTEAELDRMTAKFSKYVREGKYPEVHTATVNTAAMSRLQELQRETMA